MTKKRRLSIFISIVFSINSLTSLSWSAQESSSSFFIKKDEDGLQKSGSVYFTSTKKNEVLIKGNIWGSVQYPGVHFVPIGTRVLDALSIAGGPLDKADTDNITLSSKEKNGDLLVRKISVSKALKDVGYNPVLQADDILIVAEDRSLEKASLYLQAGTFILSVAAFSLLLQQQNK